MSETEDLAAVVEDLRDRVADLETQVAELSDDASTTSSSTFGDSRDAAVLDRLDEGQRVGVRDIKSAYRAATDIRNKRTLKARTKDLLRHGPFEGSGPWTYTGGEDGE